MFKLSFTDFDVWAVSPDDVDCYDDKLVIYNAIGYYDQVYCGSVLPDDYTSSSQRGRVDFYGYGGYEHGRGFSATVTFVDAIPPTSTGKYVTRLLPCSLGLGD